MASLFDEDADALFFLEEEGVSLMFWSRLPSSFSMMGESQSVGNIGLCVYGH